MTNNTEIERKFLVKKSFAESLIGSNFNKIVQFYITHGHNPTVRVRLVNLNKALITIKGKSVGASCPEFEYSIPYSDGVEMKKVLPHSPVIDKHRYVVEYEGKSWEVDIFWGENEGLYMAEIELSSEDEEFELPIWCGEEVTHDTRFKNINLSLNPVGRWSTIERSLLVVPE